ncbi:hypothetical protein D1BOALGB6SA_3108 [Olavius sp. associated proteobacterium Delta 1]|nr:hypothetical protein D1BOALGB6SA_3108 [Olavius sp. associated proteobacterium Delta 1]
MFYHMNLAAKETHKFEGNEFELVVYRAEEDGHLRGYISSGGFSDRIAEISGETASDMKSETGNDPADTLISLMKDEINAGKFPLSNDT